MDTLSLVAADQFDLDALTCAFNRGFEHYHVPLTQTPHTLASMIHANDVSLADSLVALDPAGGPAGIGLLALRAPRGWIAGMGVAPEWRGRGNGQALLTRLIARGRALGLSLLQLEVLDENEPARRLYSRLGFLEQRPLLVFNGPVAPTLHRASALAQVAIATLAVEDALTPFETHHCVPPCWQRERPSLAHMAPHLLALGLCNGGALAAYVLYNETGSGIAVLDAGAQAETAERRAALVTQLLSALLAGRRASVARAINVPPGDPLGDALDALGCPVTGRQQEMTLHL
jgi:ribosomal protein S18 acetylase RimI-like enzyme